MLKKLGETAGKVQKMSTYTHIIWLLANVGPLFVWKYV